MPRSDAVVRGATLARRLGVDCLMRIEDEGGRRIVSLAGRLSAAEVHELLLGHTACGAIKGAIDDVEMGNLTGLLARVKPAITATTFAGEKSSKNAAYVDAVARTNVLVGLDNVRRRSPMLADLERKQTIQIVGGMYDLATGAVELVTS